MAPSVFSASEDFLHAFDCPKDSGEEIHAAINEEELLVTNRLHQVPVTYMGERGGILACFSW